MARVQHDRILQLDSKTMTWSVLPCLGVLAIGSSMIASCDESLEKSTTDERIMDIEFLLLLYGDVDQNMEILSQRLLRELKEDVQSQVRFEWIKKMLFVIYSANHVT